MPAELFSTSWIKPCKTMPNSRIAFNVVFATGEEERHPAVELERHEPSVRGWQSARHCAYPQELVLRLHLQRQGATAAALRRVQVLAHQCLIPERIEIWVGGEESWRDSEPTSDVGSEVASETGASTETSVTTNTEAPAHHRFDYLGFITLSDNTTTGFKSRELKSVTVPPCKGRYLKLRLHRNHPNALNRYNQVGLIAINVLGDELDGSEPTPETGDTSTTPFTTDSGDPSYYISPYDDLAFVMYVDKEVAKIIREMEAKKLRAVKAERFDVARRLKAAMEQLHAAGEQLARLQLDKRRAVTAEEYGRAGDLKTREDQLRTRIYRELSVERLLKPLEEEEEEVVDPEAMKEGESEGVGSTPATSTTLNEDTGANHETGSPHLSTTASASPTPTNRLRWLPGLIAPGAKIVNPPTTKEPSVRGTKPRRRVRSAGGTLSSYEAYEERAIPVLRCPSADDHTDSVCNRSKLNDREKKQAALPITVFGVDLVELFYSKHFADKEEGLRRLREKLSGDVAGNVSAPNRMARAAVFLLHRALRDKVFAVYSLAATLVRAFFSEFVPGRVSSSETQRSVERLLPELLLKSGDSSPRVHNMAVHTLLSMADVPEVRNLHVIPVALTRPLAAATAPRLALSKLEMVEQLILNHGICAEKQSGLSARTLAELGAGGLQHPAEPVRKASERILLLIYRVNPRLVRKQLPPDDDITRRNLLYRQLFADFDLIDVERKREQQERSRESSTPRRSPPPPSKPETIRHINQTPAKRPTLTTSTNGDIFRCNNAGGSTPTLRRSATSSATNQEVSNPVMSASWTNGSGLNAKGNSSSSSSAGSGLASPSVEVKGEKENVLEKKESKEDEDTPIGTCSFCNTTDSALLTSAGLNSHYWRTCPILTRCAECKHVVEVACLADHLTDECELRALYRRCGGCTEAIPLQRTQMHMETCIPVCSKTAKRCPLCHKDVEGGEDGWTRHLMGAPSELCSGHSRLKHSRPSSSTRLPGVSTASGHLRHVQTLSH